MKIIFIILVLFFATGIYLYKMNEIPSGIYVDEAVVAYDAYSILETGKDHFGKYFPLHFRFFGAYTPPLFVYLSSLTIYFLGYDIFSLRIISFVSILISALILHLFLKNLHSIKNQNAIYLAVFFFLILPSSVFFGRIGYEVTLGLLFYSLGSYFLLRALKNKFFLILAVITFSLGTYASHTMRFLTPVTLLGYLIFFQKANLKILIQAAIVAFFTQVPNLYLASTKSFWVKSNFFAGEDLFGIIGNIISQYLTYLSPKELFFISSDINLQHTTSELSYFYPWLLVPFLIGIFFLIQNRQKINTKLIMLLLLTSVVPASLSGEFISVQRALPVVFAVMIIIALGIDRIIIFLKPKIWIPIFALLIIYSLVSLWRSYFILFPYERAEAWNYGYDKLSEFIKKNPNKNFIVDNSRNPNIYILFLYHLKYPPQKFQQEIDPTIAKNYYKAPENKEFIKFANVQIRPFSFEKDICPNNILVGDELTVSDKQITEHNLTKVFEIKEPIQLGKILLRGYKVDSNKKCHKKVIAE